MSGEWRMENGEYSPAPCCLGEEALNARWDELSPVVERSSDPSSLPVNSKESRIR